MDFEGLGRCSLGKMLHHGLQAIADQMTGHTDHPGPSHGQ
jgi:hypothetical protein